MACEGQGNLEFFPNRPTGQKHAGINSWCGQFGRPARQGNKMMRLIKVKDLFARSLEDEGV